MAEQSKGLTLPVEVVDIRPRADRSWKLSFESRELSGEDVKILVDNFQGSGWLHFQPNEIAQLDLPDTPAEPGTKTPSQRLRASIMVLWRQQGSKGDPESFYRTYMERLIEYVQSKLGDKPM
jgi:hypothetical protein